MGDLFGVSQYKAMVHFTIYYSFSLSFLVNFMIKMKNFTIVFMSKQGLNISLFLSQPFVCG